MDRIKILVLGTNPEIMQTILRLINNKPEWRGTGALNLSEAKEMIEGEFYNLVLIGAGITPEETLEFTGFCKTINYSVPIIQHYGGGSGLLFAEVYQALGK
jgi:hypothetical protein